MNRPSHAKFLARAALVLGLIVGAGCRPTARPDDAVPMVNPGPLPTYASVAAGYNKRLGGLDRLWTYTSVRFWITDDEGQERTEALDANLQIILPARLALRMDKLNTTYALLGSNDDRYWWIELGDEPIALWGTHAGATRAGMAAIDRAGGLPVHPLDVIELLGITPLPASSAGVGVGGDPSLAWSPDGRSLLVTAAGRVGQRRLWLDPATFEASRIDLLGGNRRGEQPEVVASSELSAYVPVAVRMNVPVPLIASRVMLTLPDARVELRIANPESKGAKPRPEVFDFDRVLKQYRVRDVRSLDEPAALGP